MSRILRVTKRFHFEAAHALYGHDGKCKNLHGHSYLLEVTVRGIPREEPDHPKDGMVVDFSDLKALVNREVVHRFDHCVILNANSPHKRLAADLIKSDSRVRLVPYQPSCGNMLLEIADALRDRLPSGLILHALCLCEPPDSWAEWFASDNESHGDPRG